MKGQKVHRGDPLRLAADDVNDWQDAAAANKLRGSGSRGPRANTPRSADPLAVYNGTPNPMERHTLAVVLGPLTEPPTSADLAAEMLGIDPVLSLVSSMSPSQLSSQCLMQSRLSEFLTNRIVRIEQPTSGNVGGELVILAEPIAVSAVGLVHTVGIVPLRVNLHSVSDTHVDRAVSGTSVGQGNAAGDGLRLAWVHPRVGAAAVSGEQWAMVRFGGGEESALQPCRVSQVSGSAGSVSTTCTFAYDIYDKWNHTKVNVSGGPVSPKDHRIPSLIYTAASYGEYFLEENGGYALKLWDESWSVSACSA